LGTSPRAGERGRSSLAAV